jgi:hypothetical protein
VAWRGGARGGDVGEKLEGGTVREELGGVGGDELGGGTIDEVLGGY